MSVASSSSSNSSSSSSSGSSGSDISTTITPDNINPSEEHKVFKVKKRCRAQEESEEKLQVLRLKLESLEAQLRVPVCRDRDRLESERRGTEKTTFSGSKIWGLHKQESDIRRPLLLSLVCPK